MTGLIKVTAHTHHFPSDEWPFPDRITTAAYATRRVVLEDFPVLSIAHTKEGEWHILCGTTKSKKDLLVMCLGCAFEKDRTIGDVGDLPMGWRAKRASVNEPWERFEEVEVSKSQGLSGVLFSLRDRFSRGR